MKKINIIYWVFTPLFAILMVLSAIPDILSSPDAVKMMHDQLGYPNYFIPFIGWVKVIGIVTILIPGFPRLKEWAYAGLAFDLFGAVYSQIAIGVPFSNWIFMFIWIILGAVSYMYYHKKLNLSNELPQENLGYIPA